MFQCTLVADLIWSAILCYCIYITYTEFCLHQIIFLDIVENLEGNGRKTILKRMPLKEIFLLELIAF